jgi:hypothetical protein
MLLQHCTSTGVVLFMPYNYTRNMETKRKWSNKYKRSINCRRPRGFSQKQYCKYGRKQTQKKYRRM